MEEYLMTTNGKVLDGDGGKEAFGEQILSFWVLLIGIFLFDMNVEDALRTVNGCQLEILQDKLRQQKLNEGQETLQGK